MYFKRYTRTLSIFNYGKSTGDLHKIAMFRQQYQNSGLKDYCSFSKYFWIYCHLLLACFCITSFGICTSLRITLYLRVVCTFAFTPQPLKLPFLAFSVLHCSSLCSNQDFISFTYFGSDLSYQPFLIFISVILNLPSKRCWLNVTGKCIKSMLACIFYFMFSFTTLNHKILIITIHYCQ